MASTGSGLTRRRGGGGGATGDNEDLDGNTRVNSPAPKPGSSNDTRAPETSYSSGENGHKIAFDPRDISENEERNKQPKLTLMEDVLLLGLKDKQVRVSDITRYCLTAWLISLCMIRATYRSGTTIFRTLYEGVSSLSWPSEVA